jgi:AraC family transcriptional regulator, exoenzyme S synthesis regulatory protein ExsA
MILEHKQIDLYNKMIFERAVIKAPFTVPNAMPNEACFLYVLEGSQRLHSANQRELVKSKDAVLMKCGMYFGEWLSSSDYIQCEAIAVHLYPEVLKKIYESEIPDFIKQYRKLDNTNQLYKVTDNALIDNYIRSMLFYFENPQLVDEELIKLKVKELILLLLKTEKANSIMEVISGLFSPREYSFKEVVEAHICSNLSIEELAQLTNLSVSSFKREFAKIYNDTPAHYFKTRRLEKAAELLIISELRISEIAFDCGFSELAHFSNSFQEKFNTSPSQFRLNQRHKSLS